jgi:hypothetical protein
MDSVSSIAEDRIPKDEHDDKLREIIIHVLSMYPIISPTMLQMGIGNSISPSKWRPSLEALIRVGTIKRWSDTALAPSGRHNNYTKLSLTEAYLQRLKQQ